MRRGPRLQRTLRTSASASGVGLFTGAPVTITFRAAPPSHGIIFRRLDVQGAPEVPARIAYAVDTPRHTTLELSEVRIETTEHVLSALAGMGIDNAIVELDAPEVPMFDGSAARFVEMIEAAGIEQQDVPRSELQITDEIVVEVAGARIALRPSDDGALHASYAFDGGPDCPIDAHTFAVALSPKHYAAEIARARTFSTLQEAEAARAAGLFQHVTPKDMLVIGPDGPVQNALRFDDEPARHKLLDLLGDLALAGVHIIGNVQAVQSGHALNRALAQRIAALVSR